MPTARVKNTLLLCSVCVICTYWNYYGNLMNKVWEWSLWVLIVYGHIPRLTKYWEWLWFRED